MATLSQFFPGGGGELLVYSKEISWTVNTYLLLNNPQYIDSQYVTIGTDLSNNPNRAIILSQAGDYIIRLNGVVYGTGNMSLFMSLINSANNNTIKTRTELIGVNATYFTINNTNYELLKGINANERVNLFAGGGGTIYNFSFEVFKL